jgi:hypothetical protein
VTTAKSRGPALQGIGQGRRTTGSIGGFVVRHARLVLVVAMLAVIGFGVLGFGAFGKLKTGGFQDPGAESTTAQTLTDQRFGPAAAIKSASLRCERGRRVHPPRGRPGYATRNRPAHRAVQTAVTATMRWFGPQARWLLPTAALVLVSASCGVRPAGTASAQPSGPVTLVAGLVEARPGCPVERPSRLCKPRPLSEVRVEARSLPAGETAITRTRADGRYSFRLGKGRYVLVPVLRQVLTRCPHILVAVTSPAPVRANINCDSGIR